MLHEIYFVGIAMITIIVIYLYISSEQEHKKELSKIERLEEMKHRRERELEIIRSQTEACPISGFNDPRSCYVNSNYQCSWNPIAERCDRRK